MASAWQPVLGPGDLGQQADGVAQLDVVPEVAARRCMLRRVDYQDAFAVAVAEMPERTAEQWARLIFEAAPAARRAGLRAGWTSLGLRLGPSDHPGFVLGWKILADDEGFVLLGSRSPVGLEGQLLLQHQGDELIFCTFLHQRTMAARLAWLAMDPIHRPVVRAVLSEARQRALGQ